MSRRRFRSVSLLTILKRDNYLCHYCDKSLAGGEYLNTKLDMICYYPSFEASLDHYFPLAMGGLDEKNNLVACCKHCNTQKGPLAPDEFLWPKYRNKGGKTFFQTTQKKKKRSLIQINKKKKKIVLGYKPAKAEPLFVYCGEEIF